MASDVEDENQPVEVCVTNFHFAKRKLCLSEEQQHCYTLIGKREIPGGTPR